MMKNKTKPLFFLFSFIGLLLVGAGMFFQYEASAGGYTGSVISETCEFAAPRELVVITTSMPIIAEYADVENVTVSYIGGLPLIFSEEKGTLRITQNDTFTMNLFSERITDAYVKICIPHRKYERISLSSSSGSITASALSADSFEIGTKGGDITLSGIDERASVRSESGRIDASLSSLDGNMTIIGGSGDVTLLLPRELSFGLEFLTESGSFTSDYFEENYYNKYGDAALLYGEAENLLRIVTTGGNLRIFAGSEIKE